MAGVRSAVRLALGAWASGRGFARGGAWGLELIKGDLGLGPLGLPNERRKEAGAPLSGSGTTGRWALVWRRSDLHFLNAPHISNRPLKTSFPARKGFLKVKRPNLLIEDLQGLKLLF